jgi:hypothetical protein
MTTALNEIDRDALERALEMARTESESERARFDAKLSAEGWYEAARAAVYACQCRTLELKPWQAPPSDAGDVASDPPRYGHRPEEVALRRRMLALGSSVYEPSPLEALERAERARRDERVAGGDTGMRTPDRAQPPSSQPEPQ